MSEQLLEQAERTPAQGGGGVVLYEDVLDDVPRVEELQGEVVFLQAQHKGGALPRLMAVQAHFEEDGLVALYRHPLDEPHPVTMPFTPTVKRIKEELERRLSMRFNHALIQLYRDGSDCIRDHADKTLDIEKGSTIVTYSIGARRVMVLRPKNKGSGNIRIPLPSNSALTVPLEANRTHTHSIKQDKRRPEEREEAERGPRISITFRAIATYVNQVSGELEGQGAGTKTPTQEQLIEAYSEENRTSKSWDELWRGLLFDD